MATYTLRRHRWGAALALGITVVGVGGCMAVTSMSAYEEAIDRYEIDATVDGTTLSVTETIDYNFGSESRRGIFREIDLGVIDRPGESVDLADITAASATANSELQVTDTPSVATIRVGNPDSTFTGGHRYQLGYDMVGIPDPARTGELVYIAVGDRWEVAIDDVTVRVAPDFEVTEATCAVGSGRSFDDCDVSVGDDGVVTATVPDLSPGNGVALTLGAGAPRPAAALTAPPLESSGGSTAWRDNVVKITAAGVVAGVVGVLLAGRWVRRAGRDRTASLHNPSEAAFATGDDGEGVQIDDREASRQVTIQYVPPEGLTPAQGAILEREVVEDRAKTAWLATAALDGWIALEETEEDLVLRHGPKAEKSPSKLPTPLAAIFDGRDSVTLGSYDKDFAAGWKAIDARLKRWTKSSGLWDTEQGKRNQGIAGLLLMAGLAAGLVGAWILSAGLARNVAAGMMLAAVIGLLFGAGVRAIIGGPTLVVRNAAGYALWLRTEGFRRFLAESEGHHARWAADQGLLREYSAWAVALGEMDRWNSSAAAAGIPPTDPALATTSAFVGLSAAATTTSTQPKSSGSGGSGFSGGGFSGGVGGGGGGSW